MAMAESRTAPSVGANLVQWTVQVPELAAEAIRAEVSRALGSQGPLGSRDVETQYALEAALVGMLVASVALGKDQGFHAVRQAFEALESAAGVALAGVSARES